MKLFDKHHGTQFFFAVLGTIIFICGVIIAWNQHNLNEVQRAIKNSTVLYTPLMNWSRTNDPCQVIGFGSNTERNKVAIVIKNDELGKETLDANAYQVFIAGANDRMINMPECTFYAYGDGYFTILFEDVTPFRDQLYTVMIRDNIDTSALTASDAASGITEQSSLTYDEIKMTINLGIDSMPVLPCLDDMGEKIVAEDIYADIVMAPFFADVRANLNSDLYNLHESKANFTAYRDKLTNVKVPEIPYNLDKDIIDFANHNCYKHFDPNTMSIEYSSGDHEFLYNMNVSEDSIGEIPAANTETTDGQSQEQVDGTIPNQELAAGELPSYYCYFEDVFPGCAVAEWHDRRCSDPYFELAFGKDYEALAKEMKAQGQDVTAYSLYMQDYDQYAADYKANEEVRTDMTNVFDTQDYTVWRKFDGSYVDAAADSVVNQNIVGYVSALKTYVSRKNDYFGHMNELFELEHQKELLKSTMTYTTNFTQIN